MASPNRPYVPTALTVGLLKRLYKYLDDPGAFGRVVQEFMVQGLRLTHGQTVHDNRGAGTPDCTSHDQGLSWAWEIKHSSDGNVALGERDVEGLRTAGSGELARPRLIVLDMEFPISLWVLDGSELEPGDHVIRGLASRNVQEESETLGEGIDTILRECDEDLMSNEVECKRLIIEVGQRIAARQAS